VLRNGNEGFTVSRGHAYRFEGRYVVEPDASAASYYLTLPLVVGGELLLCDARDAGKGLQGDTEFVNVLRDTGASITPSSAGLTVRFDPTQPRRGLDRDFKPISDTFLTFAALAPLLEGPTRITGIAHSRNQETDRVAGMAHELTKLGQHVIEEEDSLEIHPRPLVPGQTIETYRDHRFAMSFGILGCHDFYRNGQPWLKIKDPSCCAKTFPNFFELLESIRRESH
ncbi:MAG TPA: hypothetical protein VKC60_08555, partial [Opitutaceae bacterium]|nr:hypothetical protein [Opitutaceae bacterium]